jgi:hypothetical protein
LGAGDTAAPAPAWAIATLADDNMTAKQIPNVEIQKLRI